MAVKIEHKKRCACGSTDGLCWSECYTCDGTGREDVPMGLGWCVDCDGNGGVWQCARCFYPDDDNEENR